MDKEESKYIGDPIHDAIFGQHGIKQGIESCFGNKCYASALILIFSAIDSLANLVRPEEREENTSTDFIGWVKRYIHLKGDTVVTPDELWSARNAIVHTYGIHSRDTRRGTRVLLWMVESDNKVAHISGSNFEYVMVDIQEFKMQFYEGLVNFLTYNYTHPEKRRLMQERLPRLLVTYSNDNMKLPAIKHLANL